MERRTMQLLQAVLAPEASGEEKVHLVLSMEDGHRLQQALQLVPPQRKVVLVHIHRPAMMIPIPTSKKLSLLKHINDAAFFLGSLCMTIREVTWLYISCFDIIYHNLFQWVVRYMQAY